VGIDVSFLSVSQRLDITSTSFNNDKHLGQTISYFSVDTTFGERTTKVLLQNWLDVGTSAASLFCVSVPADVILLGFLL